MAYSLIIDIGNSATNIAIFKYSRVVATRAIKNTGDPDFSLYIHEMKAFQEENNIDPKDVEGGLISSVVPFLTRPLQVAVNSVFGKELKVYSHTYKNNFECDIDNPKEVEIYDPNLDMNVKHTFVFSEERGNLPIGFIERFCKHSKGKWAGKPIKLELWQIGNSPYAPKFQIISKPNEWAKIMKAPVSSFP